MTANGSVGRIVIGMKRCSLEFERQFEVGCGGPRDPCHECRAEQSCGKAWHVSKAA